MFFCKYNDPSYIKFEKLEIMVRIANDKNVDQLLAELKEYALEVDMDIVKRAVKAIGQVAIKIENATERCVNTLLDLINTKVNYVVQEAIVVIKDIFRKYPGYEGIIPTLCKCIDELDEPNARGSLIWIVGEYAEKISNAGDILAGFVDGFMEEFTQVRLRLLLRIFGTDDYRPNCKFLQPSSSSSLRSPTNRKPNHSCKRFSKQPPSKMTTQMSEIEHTSTGVSCPVTSKPPKVWSCQTNLRSKRLSSPSHPLSSNVCSPSSRLLPPSTTNHQNLSSAKAAMAPTPYKKLLSKSR